jgi:alkanesulfonate monooxygenase SsuD/methylene tetrahydromethanopterin reductase-like flavin-dependent oxidoreductase (luciferase family)
LTGPEIGAFIAPDATDPAATLGQIVAADESGLDLVAVQDHPYQHRFFDTWTLLAYAAGRTEHVRLVTDVANLPLRPPVVLAKSAASLDVLSDGRVELGLGAGGFWDAIVSAGGPRRAPLEAVDALVEAISILRDSWDGHGAVNRHGRHYDIGGFHPGPPPAHRIGIWLGAYGPRMLRVTGQLADGWLPSLGDHLSQEDALLAQAVIDEAARAAGRSPDDVIRAVNVPPRRERSRAARGPARPNYRGPPLCHSAGGSSPRRSDRLRSAVGRRGGPGPTCPFLVRSGARESDPAPWPMTR